MKKLDSHQMTKIEAGWKCIYHALFFWTATTTVGQYNQMSSLVQCWYNVHPE